MKAHFRFFYICKVNVNFTIFRIFSIFFSKISDFLFDFFLNAPLFRKCLGFSEIFRFWVNLQFEFFRFFIIKVLKIFSQFVPTYWIFYLISWVFGQFFLRIFSGFLFSVFAV